MRNESAAAVPRLNQINKGNFIITRRSRKAAELPTLNTYCNPSCQLKNFHRKGRDGRARNICQKTKFSDFFDFTFKTLRPLRPLR